MRLPSSQRVAIGFSVITCRPAAATCIACSACSPLGVARMTTSASRAGQQGVQRTEAGRPGPLLGPPEGLGVDVADADQLGPLGVLLEGVEVVGGDPPAARQGKPDPAVT